MTIAQANGDAGGASLPPSIAPPYRVTTQLRHALNVETVDLQPPWIFGAPKPSGLACMNFDEEWKTVQVENFRGRESEFGLDISGFAAVTAPTKVSAEDFANRNDEVIKAVYYPECEELLKKHTGANRVVIFNHQVRTPRVKAVSLNPDTNRHPVQRAHIDQTPRQAHKLRNAFGGDKPFSRFGITNVWRPFGVPVRDWPLAVGHFKSFDLDKDLQPTRTIPDPRRKQPDSENFYIHSNDNQKWYFYKDLQPDEALLLKIYDSASRKLNSRAGDDALPDDSPLLSDDIAGFSAHTSFLDEQGKKEYPTESRQSVELRALLFWD